MELVNFIKYCLGFVKLTRERTIAAQQKFSINLPDGYFDLEGLLNGDRDGGIGETINLSTFYAYDPKDVPSTEKEQYTQEKEVANKIDEIYNKYRNNQYTQQIIFNFGYFEIELPEEIKENDVELEGEEDEKETTILDSQEGKSAQTKIARYPLFSLPVRIEKEISKDGVGRYVVYFVDQDVQVNIGVLQSILGDDLYFQLLEAIGKCEVEGQLTLPITDLTVFKEIWHKIKAQLRLKDAMFDEDSFSLEEIKIALSPKANYFLAEDLAKLAQLTEEELSKTALISWTKNEDLNNESEVPKEKDLYFPFLYDKYQISTLSLLGNKAAIVQGPPGTGKSETISNILCHLAATGKRVLFVSQKAQALKVVKDKLNTLGVKYLYGYLPNPNSAQIGEKDEADGIAPQLSALSAFVEDIDYAGELFNTQKVNVEICGLEKEELRLDFNSTVGTQRKYYQLCQEYFRLKEYDVDVSDLTFFSNNFLSAMWHDIKKNKEEIRLLHDNITQYERTCKKSDCDSILSGLDWNEKQYAEIIGKIRDDASQTGYDRHFALFRRINNLRRRIRLSKLREKLPREIIDYIDNVLSSPMSRNETVKQLDFLYDYCSYQENKQRLEKAKQRLQSNLKGCGVSEIEYTKINNLIENKDEASQQEVRRKILRIKEVRREIQTLFISGDCNQIALSLKQSEMTRSQCVAHYIQNIINNNIVEKLNQKTRGVKLRGVIMKFARAFGKSKKAFKTFDNLRKEAENFKAILEIIPVWIMELDDASRIIPLQANIFDYVILDEASQCNVAYTLPVMYRSNHVLFVGDSEQMRDNAILFKSDRIFDELARKYCVPEELQIKASKTAVQSVLDIAANRGFLPKTLRYHYRSPMELIGFSNKHFYKPKGKNLIALNNNYLTYKDTNRVIIVHEVKSDWNEEIADKVNVAEAKAILDLFKELREDERYRDKSVGILAFFNAQATYIRKLFEAEGLKEEKDNYLVSIVEGIQGDQKDIIIYSFVIRMPEQKNKYVPLTGEGGDIRADINKGRVNVAFSRARLQSHCFISIPLQEMPEKIWLKKYLRYAVESEEITFHSANLNPFDSHFEEDFYGFLRANLAYNYKIQNQVKSCGFKIDFVISNGNTAKRIAVECDGPTHFKDEIDEAYGIYVENDEERQRVLEAAGWTFYRIKYSDWINRKYDRKLIVPAIVDLLQ